MLYVLTFACLSTTYRYLCFGFLPPFFRVHTREVDEYTVQLQVPTGMNMITPDAAEQGAPDLPLHWTRIKRRRNDDGETRGGVCCDDATRCRIRPHRFRLIEVGVQGHVVFCLHELDPSWFQGYFIPQGTRQPWGLLAVQNEIEDCLACSDGGFRRLSITVYPPSSDPITLETVDWTGGDLIHLSHEQLEVESNRIWTGEASLHLIEKYFKGLVRRMRVEYDVDENEPILEWLPDIVIVSGTMIIIPTSMDDGAE